MTQVKGMTARGKEDNTRVCANIKVAIVNKEQKEKAGTKRSSSG